MSTLRRWLNTESGTVTQINKRDSKSAKGFPTFFLPLPLWVKNGLDTPVRIIYPSLFIIFCLTVLGKQSKQSKKENVASPNSKRKKRSRSPTPKKGVFILK